MRRNEIMDTNKLVAGIVATAIAVIMLAGVLMPALSTATDTHDTFTNDGYFGMAYTETNALTLSWDYTKPGIITVDGVEKTIRTDYPAYTFVNILCGDNWFLRYNGSALMFYSDQVASVEASVTASTSLNVVAADGSVTVSNTKATPDTQTTSYTFMYVFDPEGEYVMKDMSKPCYLNGKSDIYAIGRSSATGIVMKMKITGNITDGFTPTLISSTSATTTLGDVVPTYQAVEGYKDLYKLTQLTTPVDYIYTDQSYHIDVVYSYFIIPAEVTAEKEVHLSPAANMILDVIPIIIIVAVLLGVVAIFMIRRE